MDTTIDTVRTSAKELTSLRAENRALRNQVEKLVEENVELIKKNEELRSHSQKSCPK